MSSNPTLGLTSVTCSFNNTRQSSITVVKKTLGGDATFQFNGPSPFAITTLGGTGQKVFPAVPPGTYTVSEIVPPGWIRSNTACTDPTGDTTVVGGTATIKLGAGEDVTCTYTDTKLGAIQVSKHTVGGDGTFSFSGPQNFQITTTSGAGGPFALPNLAPGTYTISEAVPADWQLSGIVCTDPTNDSTTSGSTATINLAPGEIVACTFTDTRQASVTVEKQTLGGDGTFAFTGSQSFSITTTAGNGTNTDRVRVGRAGRGAVDRRIRAVRVDARQRRLSRRRERRSARNRDRQRRIGHARRRSGDPLHVRGHQGRNAAGLQECSPAERAKLRLHPYRSDRRRFLLAGGQRQRRQFEDVHRLAGRRLHRHRGVRAGWVNTGITCSDVVEPDLGRRTTIDRAAASFTAHLRFGQTVDCTFTNTQIQPEPSRCTRRRSAAMAPSPSRAADPAC